MSPLNLALLLSMDWWVPTPQDAEELQAALDQYWTQSEVQVQVGEPAQDQPGIQVLNGQLIWSEDERQVQQPCPSSPGAQVLLVKSWTQALEHTDQGWVPEVELDDFLPDPAPGPTEMLVPAAAPAPKSERIVEPKVDKPAYGGSTQLSLSAGVGLQSALLAEPWRLSLSGTRYGRRLNQALWLVADFGGQPRYANGTTQRFGPQLGVGLSHVSTTGSAGEIWAFAGARSLVFNGSAQDLLPSAGLKLRGWGPPVGQQRIGVSLSGQLEGLEQQRSFYDGEELITTMAMASAYIEFVIGRPM